MASDKLPDEPRAETKPSMVEFDYFADKARPLGFSPEDPQPDVAELRFAAYDKRRLRAGRHVVIASVFCAVTLWFVSGYRDLAAYALRGKSAALMLGDVTGLAPEVIPHNSYVSLEGITELRGMTQSLARGLTLLSSEYHYFRLLGSRGVFIEVPPDAGRFGLATRVNVTGRAVDPIREPRYNKLLETYYRLYPNAERRPHVRIVQVDLAPGDELLRLLGGGAALGVLLVLNAMSLAQYVRVRRQKPVGHIVPARDA